MAIDIRANVTCSLGTVISGTIGDDYIQNSGLIKTQGSVIISGLITPSIGTIVTFQYTKSGVTRFIPRKLRVLSSFADPYRRTTQVELGCKLTYLSELKDQIDWDAFDDPENGDMVEEDSRIITVPIRASSIMNKCLEELGITASDNPLTNNFSIATFSFDSGYTSILSDLLLSESYCGYLDENEVLQIFSLTEDGLTGPVLSDSDIIDLGPIGVGQLPGEAVTVTYSSLKLKQPEDLTEQEEKELNWEYQETIGAKTFITVQYTNPNWIPPDKKFYNTWTYIPRTVSITYYDAWDRVKSRVSTQYMIGAAVNTQYYVDSWAALAVTGGGYIGFYEISEQQIVETETFSYVLPARGKRPQTGYEEVLQRKSIREEPQMAIAGSIAASFLEDDGSLVNYMPLYGSTITEEIIETYETKSAVVLGVFTPITKTIVSKRMAYGYTQFGQQETARQLEAGASAISAIYNSMYLVDGGTEVTINSGRGVGLQERPTGADLTNASYAKGGDPNNGFRTESKAQIELAVGSAAAQLRIEFSLPYAPDDIFSKTSAGSDPETGEPIYNYSSIPSDAPVKATRYGRIQNRILLGNRNGINLQLAPEKLPSIPYTPLYVQINGVTAMYRANGTSWTFDSSGIIASVDALFWGAVGGAGSFWFPVAPGIVTLPSSPPIVDTSPTVLIGTIETVGATPQAVLNAAFPSAVSGDGVQDETSGHFWVYSVSTWNDVGTAPGPTITPTTIVTPYNETVIYNGILHTRVDIIKFDYSLELLTVVPSMVMRLPSTVRNILPINLPDVIAIEIIALEPTVSAGAGVLVPVNGLSLVTYIPSIITGASVAIPSRQLGFEVSSLPYVGRMATVIQIPAASTIFTIFIPNVFGGSDAKVPLISFTLSAIPPAFNNRTPYNSLTFATPGSLSYTGVAMGYVFTVGANDLVVNKLEVYGFSTGYTEKVRIHKNSNASLVAQASMATTADAWVSATISPVTLLAGEQYTISGWADGFGRNTYNDQTGVSFYEGITFDTYVFSYGGGMPTGTTSTVIAYIRFGSS